MMAGSSNKVVFGISNVHYAVLDPEHGTYGTPVAIPGAVKLSMTREGDSSKFYADNGSFVVFETNDGYSGDLEMAYVPSSALKALLNYIEDSHHIILEDSDATPVRFALMYEVSSNISEERFIFYDCVLSRPENEANTKTDSTDPDTQTMHITMSPHEFAWGQNATKKLTKGYVVNDTNGASTYASWFTAVQTPTPSA